MVVVRLLVVNYNSPDMPLAAGVRLGPYEVVSLLGVGGMGEVYRAKDPRLGREVAVKVLPPSFAGNEERLRRFEQEARAAGSLNHPNILAIYDIGVHDGSPYVVSELLQGMTLRGRLGQGPIPPRKVIEIAIQVARGMAAAHERRIVHRDLKPENLFLTTDGQVKILDFGLAKFAEPESETPGKTQMQTVTSLTQAGFVVGTIGYMSPEQVRGQAVDHRSDIFSLGAILYEMLSGRQAFHGGSSADTMAAILKEDPPNLMEEASGIPPAMAHVVRHCLEKNPAERFQSAYDLAFDLEALLGGSRTTSAMVATRSRGKMLRVLGAVAMGAVLAAGIFIGMRQVRTGTPTYHWLAFRSGTVLAARFAPDGRTVVYSAAWEGKPSEIFTTRPESPESRSLGLAGASLLAVSLKGEMAILLGIRPTSLFEHAGTLARVPLEGGSPREVVQNAEFADWTPDGASLLVVREANGRDRLEFPPGNLIYETGGWIGHPRFSPRGNQIAYFDHPDRGDDIGSLAVMDLTGHRRTLATGWTDLTGLAWSAGGDEVWFTGTRASGPVALMAVALSGREREVTKVPGDLHLFDVGTGGRVLMARDDWRAGIYSQSRGTDKERNLSWFDFSIPDDLSGDGSILLFHEAGMAGGPDGSAYLRKTDGSPPVQLVDGGCTSLSPQGDRAICDKVGDPSTFFLVPTKAGETKQLSHGPIRHLGARWFPDEKRILFLGVESGHGARLYIQNIAGGPPQAITPEGVNQYAYALSPDGSQIAAAMGPESKLFLFPTNGGDPRPIAGLDPGDWPIGWSEDGRWLYTYRFGELPATISRFELATQKKTLWKQLMPPEPSGVDIVSPILVTPDGKSYAYGFVRIFSDLYVVEGLR
jgi:eukaryotic-like serine/threonine-protein kinase